MTGQRPGTCQRTPSGASTFASMCDEPATHQVTVACVHEHFTNAYVCGEHLGGLLGQIEHTKAYCAKCTGVGCRRCVVRLFEVADLRAELTS